MIDLIVLFYLLMIAIAVTLLAPGIWPTFGLSKKYRIKVIGGNGYIPQCGYLILWKDIWNDECTKEMAQRVIEQDKSGELRAKDIKYIDIK